MECPCKNQDYVNAIQLGAAWERAHANLVEVGLPVADTEKVIAYIQKVGSFLSKRVRLERKPRPDGAGGTTVRIPETWEECHDVLCEIECQSWRESVQRVSRSGTRSADRRPRTTRELDQEGNETAETAGRT